MDIENFGSYLAEKREEKNYTIADVEAEIKIRGSYLKAIEEENYHQLPQRVYTVGFVRRYSAFLQLESDEIEAIVQHYKDAMTREENGSSAAVPPMQGIETRERKSGPLEGRKTGGFKLNRVLLAGILLLGIAWACIFAYSFISEKWAEHQQKVAEQAAELQQAEVVIPEEPAPEELPPAEPVAEASPVYNDLQVVLTVNEGGMCWIDAVADGAGFYTGIKNSGETLEFAAREQFSLNLGSAGAVKLQVNGQDVTGSDWRVGQVLTIGYTLEGWRAQFPQP